MYELIQHTADIRMRVAAPSLEALFLEALRGLSEIIEPAGVTAETVTLDVDLEAAETTTLLVDFLNEALTRTHVGREVYTRASFRELTPTRAVGTLDGVRVEGFAEDVKAVTYHDAEVVHRGGEWSTLLVFDI